MLKPFIAAIIAASALVTPALAQDHHRGDRGNGGGWGHRSESSGGNNGGGWQRQSNDNGGQARQEWRQSRQDSGQQQQQQRSSWRQQQPAQVQQAPQQAQQPQQWRSGNRGQWNRGDRGQWNGGQQRQQQVQQAQQPQQWRGDRGQDQQRWRGGNRGQSQWQGQQGYRGNQFANRGGNRWSNNWRGDNRYDWRDWRNSHRSNYRLPRYYAPRGYNYGYRRFSIGYTLSSLLFGSQYWIEDPFYYRLPPAYGPYRWVRYYNDALLVDIETGEVVDVEYDIFW